MRHCESFYEVSDPFLHQKSSKGKAITENFKIQIFKEKLHCALNKFIRKYKIIYE
jgi:hypothetical protein